jgi:broad specificity phosphatase PhoE
MTHLILVKHAMPNIVPNVPAQNWALSEEGMAQSVQLAERLRRYHPHRVFASREPKAAQTGVLLAATLELPFEALDDLHEQARANEGYHSPEVFRAKLRAFFKQPNELVFGTETADAAYTRFAAVLDRLSAQHPNETLIIATHGTVLSLFLARRAGLAPFEVWESLSLPDYRIFDTHTQQLVE